MEDRIEAAREMMRQLDTGPAWESALDPDLPEDLRDFALELFGAYRRGDLDWLIEHTDPEIVIVQVPEIPDSETYTGHDGLIDALLDWPRQWEDFRMEPRRIFDAGPGHFIVVAQHKGRPHSMDIEVEAEFAFLFGWRDGVMTSWEMFLTVDEALSRASEGSGHGDDDHAAERDGRERPHEARAEELRPDHR
jgi:ketosteroid isomerase-like protein